VTICGTGEREACEALEPLRAWDVDAYGEVPCARSPRGAVQGGTGSGRKGPHARSARRAPGQGSEHRKEAKVDAMLEARSGFLSSVEDWE
jgi:hypothetical protein